METLKFGYKYFKKSMPLAVVAEIMSIVGIYCELLVPLLAGMLVDFVIKDTPVTAESGGKFHFLLSGRFGQVHTFSLFTTIAIAYGILMVLRIVLIYIRDIIQEYIGLRLEGDLRVVTYQKLMELDSDTLGTYNSGELLQILNSDTIMFKELFAHRIAYLIDAIFLLAFPVVMIAEVNVAFIVIPLILAPFLVTSVLEFKKRAKENFAQIRATQASMNLTTQENIAAVRIVRSFTNEELEKEKFQAKNTDFYNARHEQVWLQSKFDLTFNAIKQIAYVSTIIIGTYLVMHGQMTVGYILTTSSYVMRIMNSITGLNNHIFNMQQQTIAGLSMKKFMETESQVPDNGDSRLHSDTPQIEIKNLSLTIDEQEILKDINISIPYGKKLGIVGETGSGKSVLLKTLVRIRDITDGQIVIDGHDIKDYSLRELREMYSFVFQDVFLFSNTIESNIAFSNPDADQRMVTKSAMHAQANTFIDAMADRYKTIIGERGLGISGGQKQRVSIARAFHKNAPIFVLDDSTSALDVNTEKALLGEIDEHYKDKTLIITASRFSSVVGCDEIIYMSGGQITERGTFEELMALDGSFARVYNTQAAQKADALKGGEVNG